MYCTWQRCKKEQYRHHVAQHNVKKYIYTLCVYTALIDSTLRIFLKRYTLYVSYEIGLGKFAPKNFSNKFCKRFDFYFISISTNYQHAFMRSRVFI